MSFVGKFFLLVLVVGFSELYLLVEVAARLSFGVTLGLCILTGMLGGALVRQQGLKTLAEVQRSMGRGKLPAEEIVAGLVLLVVGATLIMPGFVTDTVGFLLLVPPIRKLAAAKLVHHFKDRIQLSPSGPAVFGGPMPGMGFDIPQQDPRGEDPQPGPTPAPSRDPRPPLKAEVIDVRPSKE